ncbi:hypothetical protein N7499_004363 [Penicillium canescens]|uniref:uncharacterized protein n=1 Tax=Penicillium canescens TaxID=5083 RepID=UPI0026E01448|nr:uncharacterized protein N7446_005343 [Penicillium canescens]KAJ6010233.1 hypothetical protein N7522_005249 [Penicillium canescens]KAJ6039400.1 hypothetical protein N7444_008305 [Penicillium canescens]KAJ6068306.1 hypothetical protein N7446_005343 [Penicillium canescens]KAJ6084734.1 hypothetical protein N7499_004363 [Penicillium canescens]KAJ6161520.1 hypothetical protein N7485_009750 [Penicillium canescens]
MEIIQQSETFKDENGKLQFCWQSFYVRHEGNIHYGTGTIGRRNQRTQASCRISSRSKQRI